MAKYVITEQMYYRQGRKYQPGDTIDLPAGEKPAPHWKKVDDTPTAAQTAAAAPVPSMPPLAPAESGKGKKGGGAPNPI